MATIENLRSWVERDLSRFGKISEHLHDKGIITISDSTEKSWRFSIYTETNQYAIVATERGGNSTYLGCQSSGRKPRAGLDYTGGRDLADGPLTEETWRKILCDIVSFEIVRVHPTKEEMTHQAVVPGPKVRKKNKA